MSTRPMTCGEFTERLSEFLEHELDDAARAAMEHHAASCIECGALIADLRQLRVASSSLPVLVPSRDLWAGIAARIETPVLELKPGSVTPAQRQVNRFSVNRNVWLGVAAAALVAVTATVTHEVTKRAVTSTRAVVAVTPTPGSANPATPDTANAASHQGAVVVDTTFNFPSASASKGATTSLASNSRAKISAEETYDHEISALLVIVDHHQTELDSSTVAVITHNLRIIDDAIAQCRLALKKDPASRYLMQSLDDALNTKVQLLRTAALLPART